ncbi:MAG: hypothetical protein JXR58_04585 [Bacteroidales bacterium]|nr:hypothetical protein [Bacteroidales bacterium]
MKTLLFSLIGLFLFIQVNAQIALGEWRDHLPYTEGLFVAKAETKVYCANASGLSYLDLGDNSINRLNKVQGLSDVGISSLAYNSNLKILFIGYSNGNIDLIENNTIINISDIKRKSIIGSKSVNNVFFESNLAYLSCGFGIVVLDLTRREIRDTYYIGENGVKTAVYDLTSNGTFFFAATEKGIYKADKNSPNLVDFAYWERLDYIPNYNKEFNNIAFFNNQIFSTYNNGENATGDTLYIINETGWQYVDTTMASSISTISEGPDKLLICGAAKVYMYRPELDSLDYIYTYGGFNISSSQAICDENNSELLWVADKISGLVRKDLTQGYGNSFVPNGPSNFNAFSITAENNEVWVCAGGRDGSWNNLFRLGNAFVFSDNNWTSKTWGDTPYGRVRDVIKAEFFPGDQSRVFIATWGFGLMELKNKELVNIHKADNSSLQSIYEGQNYVRLGGLCFDAENNCWVTNSGVPNPISVLTPSGDWFSFPYGSLFNNTDIGEILVTQTGNKWVLLPRGRGLFAFNENGTFEDDDDDNYKAFSVLDETGAIISNDIYDIAEDKNGTIWVATNKGAVAYFNPDNIFENSDFYAQKIILDLDGTAQYLLETEIVTCIAIDGANRKWFGTQNSGVYLMSEDCTDEIYRFNKDNSPLYSNSILSIDVEPASGEVFIGTDKGIISFRSTATEPNNLFGEVYAFPNPVKHDYQGDIVIKGLVANSNVKITDIAGNLVFETNALGGQAIWNGKTVDGDKVKTGVYLAFCTNEDGSKTHVTKILVIN